MTPAGASVPLYADTHGAMAASPPGVTASHVPVPSVDVAWPGSSDALQAVVWADLLGAEFTPVTREVAMSVPAVARQRHLLAGSLARCPLVDMVGDTVSPVQPTWLYRTDSPVSTYHRMLWTVDDLLFYGWSLWARTNDAIGRLPLDAVRVPFERWAFTKTGTIEVDREPVKAAEVILIPGPHEGIIQFGASSIRMAKDNLRAAANAARNPAAHLELHYTGDEPLKTEDRAEYLAEWAKARRGENGGVAWTGKNMELKEHGTHEAALLIDGRNADAVDMSRLVSSPAAMADATNAGASLTYETTDGRNGQFVDYGVSLYADSITARLSLDDCTVRGHRVAFDMATLRNVDAPTTGAPTAD